MTPDAPIRVLVVDDESPIRDAYLEVLDVPLQAQVSEAERLRRRLFDVESHSAAPGFEVRTADRAEASVDVVREALENGAGFEVVFMDMRMPPGRDGAWAAATIRALDPNVDIVIVTAYSDVDPQELSARIPPMDRLFYLQKPFHAHEVRQLAIALGRKSRAEARIRRLAYFDSLTGLANRDRAGEELCLAIMRSQAQTERLSVLFIDLDNFARINDTLGHSVGDEILRATADRLRTVVCASSEGRVAAQLARMGGDEFLVMLPVTAGLDAAALAARIAKALEPPIRIGSHDLFVTASMGIAMFPDDGQDIESLLRNADLAMYFAKRTRARTYEYYHASMNATALKRMTVESQLRGAMSRGELKLEYQPQMNLRTGRIDALEALLRWKNAELGEVPPLEFITVAEELGMIHELGDWVLQSACRQAVLWVEAGLQLTRIAVNVSAVQLRQEDFPDRLAAVLERTGIDPSMLEIELTESSLIDDIERARGLIERIKALGVSIAIDDFGVGYASLSYLSGLAVDRLKIDKAFIAAIHTDERQRAITAAIIAMAQSMRLRVTAEGVESQPQLAVLRTQHCDDVQGYLIATPLPAAEAAARLLPAMPAQRAAG